MATSKLQRFVSKQLSIHFGGYTIRENIRPDWLITPQGERLELDFLIEELDIAIEVQGGQHYIYVPYFHGDYDNYLKRLEWDKFKKETCFNRGVKLFEIAQKTEVRYVFDRITTLIPEEKFEIDLTIPRISGIAKQKKGQYKIYKRELRLVERYKEKIERAESPKRIETLRIKMKNALHRIEKMKEAHIHRMGEFLP